MGVPHRVGSVICFFILSEKGKVLSHTTVHNLTDDEPRYNNVQERIRYYHGLLETALLSEEFCTNLDGYDYFIYDD